MTVLSVYQTTAHRGTILTSPIYGEGAEMWLGDGYYFWQDKEFAMAWGFDKKCQEEGNIGKKFDVYTSELKFASFETDFIDTVFNKEDYEFFCGSIERFARNYSQRYGRKPTLEQFNNFTKDQKIWGTVKAIRFQDLPANDKKDFLHVKGFPYKKRIQIVVYDKLVIHNFKFYLQRKCSDL